MTIETCLRCGRARDDADDEAYDDDWMPIFDAAGRRAHVVCPACVLPEHQIALERWIDDFDPRASEKAALEAAASAADDQLVEAEFSAHERFCRLFTGVDLQRLSVSQVDHWIRAWRTYNKLVRMPAAHPAIRSQAIELTEALFSLEDAGVVPAGSAYALAFAYGITNTDLPIARSPNP